MNNILFLGGGRRVELLKLFQKKGFNLFSYEKTVKVPIVNLATIIEGRDWKDPITLLDFSSIIKKYEIDLMIPLQDEAVVLAALFKELYDEVSIPVPSYLTARTCFDKKSFETFMLENFIDFYPNFSHYPAILKPRYGFGSKDICILDAPISYSTEEYILQNFIKGTEFSVDTYFDPNGEFVDGVSRTRDRVSGGEVISSTITKENNLIAYSKEIGEYLKIIGPANFQWIVEKDTQKKYIIEINCRFGGGMTLSIASGFDIPSLICKDYLSIPFAYNKENKIEGMRLERSYRDHFFY